jgi:hypothetical protein
MSAYVAADNLALFVSSVTERDVCQRGRKSLKSTFHMTESRQQLEGDNRQLFFDSKQKEF